MARAYVAYSSWFDAHRYDREKISEVLRDAGAKNIRESHSFGMRNQPKVVTFDPGNVSLRTYEERVGESLGTPWILVMKMRWGGRSRPLTTTFRSRRPEVRVRSHSRRHG